MKKWISIIIICSCLISITHAFDFSACEERCFTVTAYYSPESGQVFYYKPSFEEEITLNGEGHVGASGKQVFNGMLAGPASYAFGSIIYFPGFGVGEIADRGGAIVVSGEKDQSFDRIDVWMGKGEQGLIRALTFGKKNMTGYFCDDSIVKTTPKDSLLRDNVPTFKNFFDIALRIEQIEEGRKDIRTRTLQKYLVKLGYLNKRYWNGNFESNTKKALCRYQVAKRIVSSQDYDCGVFGSMTRYTMKLDVQSKNLLPQNLYATGTFDAIIDLAKYYNGKPTESHQSSLKTEKIQLSWINHGDHKVVEDLGGKSSMKKVFLFYRAYTKGQQSSEIKILQTFLQSQGLYSGSIDGIYSQYTIDAVYAFQKKYSLITNHDPLVLRGFLGPKTRIKINEIRMK